MSDSINIQIGEELGRFTSHSQWVSHAKRVYEGAYNKIGSKDVITLDSAIPRRIVHRGLQFNVARDECTFPVVIYSTETSES